MLKDAAKEFLKSKPSELKRLGIDEIALIKGKGNYCSVLIDLDKSKLITILPGRTQEKIREVHVSWGEEVLERIEEVSIDLCKGYKNIAKELIPKAQVAADRFHVMAQVNQELDVQRKQEKSQLIDLIKKPKPEVKKAQYQKSRDCLNKSKYVLPKNEKDLSEDQKAKLIQVKYVSSHLPIMHELKEKIRKIFEEIMIG